MNDEAFWVGFLTGVVCTLVIVVSVVNYSWRSETIQHGVAHYDTMTGKWEWNK